MASPSPRRRFQFRLRTLLIGVAVVAVVCAFVRWHYDFVCQRKVMMHRIEIEDHGSVEVHFTPVKFEETKPLPWFRRVLVLQRYVGIAGEWITSEIAAGQ